MNQLVLLVGLRDDQTNTIASVISYEYRELPTPLLKRDGVFLLGDNHVLLDPAKAHSALVQVCATLEEKSWPYLLLRMDGPASLAAGKLPEAVVDLLRDAGVQFVPQL